MHTYPVWVGSNDFNNNQSQMSSQTGAQNQASNASQSQQTANKKPSSSASGTNTSGIKDNASKNDSAKDKIYEKEDGTFVIGGGKKKTYATLKEAEDIVCERNQNRIESVAEKCKGSIPMCAYEAMLNWDVRLAMCG